MMKVKENTKNKDDNGVLINETHTDNNRDYDWFADQYQKLIGTPLVRKEISTDKVLKKLQKSVNNRRIPEAKAYKASVRVKSHTPQAGNVHYIEWRGPKINKCKCPDSDCTCRRDVLYPKKKIPRGQRYFKSALCRKFMRSFRKSDQLPSPEQNFVQRLATVVGVETAVYEDLGKNGILNVRGAEYCLSRCIRYYGPGRTLDIKQLLDKYDLKDKDKEFHTSTLNKVRSDDGKDQNRSFQGYTSTVATQSTVGSNGELIVGDFSHTLYGTFKEATMKDIDGTKLHFTSCNFTNNNSEKEAPNLSFERLLNLRDILNVRKLKNQISLLKRNVFSSSFAGKEARIHTISTQYDHDGEDTNDSLEDIIITTPYKGMMVKRKREGIEYETKNQLPDTSEIQKERSVASDTSKVTLIQDYPISQKKLKDKSLRPQEIEVEFSTTKAQIMNDICRDECKATFSDTAKCK